MMHSDVIDKFFAQQPFEADDFQRSAVEALCTGHHVIVSAPTGSGKTLVAEAAAELALASDTRLFYTTPIKALSNQKYRDFCAHWGTEQVGLLTGDTSINSHAPLIVMTTEVLRNMIYADSPNLLSLRYIVMDEVHYLSDRFRGAVWEEIILSLPPHCQLIALSATIGNAKEFRQWIHTVCGSTELVSTNTRPVPLTHHMIVGNSLYALDNRQGTDVSSVLQHRIARCYQDDPPPRFPSRTALASLLQREDLLPAIDFIFSRAGCDAAVAQCGRSRLQLTSPAEYRSIRKHIEKRCSGLSESDRETLHIDQWTHYLARGFASHHAGLLPLQRHIVEELFSAGLIKLVFATETLALGINMPARSVVVEKLVKFDGISHVDLTSTQYQQLTGRAGRRGRDTHGYALIYYSPQWELNDVWMLTHSAPGSLQSSFAVGYNMVINLLSNYTRQEALSLIQRSFAQFQAERSVVSLHRRIDRLTEEIKRLDHRVLPTDDPTLGEYLTLLSRLNAEEKHWKKQRRHAGGTLSPAVFRRLRVGDVICISGRSKPVLAAVIDSLRQGKVTVMTHHWTGRIGREETCGAHHPLGNIALTPEMVKDLTSAALQQRVGRLLSRSQIRVPRVSREKRLSLPKSITTLRAEIAAHPLHGTLDSHEIAELQRMRQPLLKRRARLERRSKEAEISLARDFDAVVDILRESGYLTDEDKTTPAGDLLKDVFHDTDYLCTEVLRERVWENLDPAELAALCSLLTAEPRREEIVADWESPTAPLQDAYYDVLRIAEDIHHRERRHRCELTRELSPRFMLAVHQWTCGAPLDYCLADLGQGRNSSPTAGDFIRHLRQVGDLLSQWSNIATNHSEELSTSYAKLREAAQLARTAVRREMVIDEL